MDSLLEGIGRSNKSELHTDKEKPVCDSGDAGLY